MFRVVAETSSAKSFLTPSPRALVKLRYDQNSGNIYTPQGRHSVSKGEVFHESVKCSMTLTEIQRMDGTELVDIACGITALILDQDRATDLVLLESKRSKIDRLVILWETRLDLTCKPRKFNRLGEYPRQEGSYSKSEETPPYFYTTVETTVKFALDKRRHALIQVVRIAIHSHLYARSQKSSELCPHLFVPAY